MFAVECLGVSSESVRSIGRGCCFGFGEQPIKFEVTSERISNPLEICFVLKENSKYDPVTFVLGEMKNDSLDMTFYNVREGGPGGLITPVDIVRMENFRLSFFFRVDRAMGADSYSISYEFFERRVSESSE